MQTLWLKVYTALLGYFYIVLLTATSWTELVVQYNYYNLPYLENLNFHIYRKTLFNICHSQSVKISFPKILLCNIFCWFFREFTDFFRDKYSPLLKFIVHTSANKWCKQKFFSLISGPFLTGKDFATWRRD